MSIPTKASEEISFGEWLRQRRRMLDLTQQALANQVGCARITLRRIESGVLKPSKELAEIMLEKLGIPETEYAQWIHFARGLSGFPAMSGNSLANKPLTNLPASLTTFIGREKEQAEIMRLIAKNRLVTLVGPGGIGKTSLSLQVGQKLLNDYPNGVGVRMVMLDSLTDPALVPQSVASVFDIRGMSENPILERLIFALRTKSTLLILDNCEHLLDSCAQLITTLLTNCSNLKIIATSREALGVAGEALYHVPPLALPDTRKLLEKFREYEAVRLFEERAQLVQANFALTLENASYVSQICHCLDGIPLAIELAAAHVNMLSTEQIAARLNENFNVLTSGGRIPLPRHETLRASMDWSWDLLADSERIFLRRLSVFAGGWTLEAAEAVCSVEGIESDLIPDLLSHLINKSLVVVEHTGEESRYRLLKTIRQYAREKLFETEDAQDLRSRHLDYFIQIAEQGFEELRGPNDLVWLEKLEIEHDNFRAALGWAISSPDVDPQKALQLSGALYEFWIFHGHSEGYRWLAEALKTTPDALTVYWCRALFGIAQVSYRIGRFNEASEYSENALTTARQLDIPALIIESLFVRAFLIMAKQVEAEKLIIEGLALARATENKYLLSGGLLDSITIINRFKKGGEAMKMAQEAYEIARSLGNTGQIARSLFRLGTLKGSQGNYKEARSLLQESEILSRKLKDKMNVAYSLLQLGILATKETDFVLARQFEEESLQIFQELLGDPYSASFALFNLGWTAYVAGDYASADSRFKEAKEARNSSTRDKIYFYPTLTAMALVNLAQGNEKYAGEMFAESLELLKSFEDGYWLAKCLEGMSGLSALSPETAACLLGCAEAIYEEMAFMISLSERLRHDLLVEKARTQLGEEKFNTLWANGKAMTYKQAIAYALECLK
jgi:predicted ATPase/DNA-binding XRE family transcriptional regulator